MPTKRSPGARKRKPGETHAQDARVEKPAVRPKMFLDDIKTLEDIRKARMEILRASANCPTPDENLDPFSTYVPGTFNSNNGHLCLQVLEQMERGIQAQTPLTDRLGIESGARVGSKGVWNEAIEAAVRLIQERRSGWKRDQNRAASEEDKVLAVQVKSLIRK